MIGNTINTLNLTTLPKIKDARGSLTYIENNKHIPFEVKRIFYLYDIPTDENRGAHAHRALQQFIICLSGSFEVSINDGARQTDILLSKPSEGLHIPPMFWVSVINFAPGSICLVLTSDYFCEKDYIRDYNEFISLVQEYGNAETD